MSSSQRERVLKRVPYLRLALNSRNEVQLQVGGRHVSCGAAALRVLEHFARPRPLSAALKELAAGLAPPARAALIQTIFYLLDAGVLRDVTDSAPDDTQATPAAAPDVDDGPADPSARAVHGVAAGDDLGGDGAGGGQVGGDGAARLLVNPSVELTARLSLTGGGGAGRTEELDAAERPELLCALVEIASGEWRAGRAAELPRRVVEQLIALEVLTLEDEASDEVYFDCFLDTLSPDGEGESSPEPDECAPSPDERARPSQGDSAESPQRDSAESRRSESAQSSPGESAELVLGERVWLQRGAEVPAEIAARVPFRDRFREAAALLWVEDARTGALWPYWLRGGWPALAGDLLRGGASHASLKPGERAALRRAGALVPRGSDEEKRIRWREERARLRGELESQGHAALRAVVPPPQLAALARYFRALEANAYLKESSNRHRARNRRTLAGEETARFVQQQLAEVVNEIVPAPVAPTHATLSVYRPGASLARHTDIADCRWNISLLVETDPPAGLGDAWPLCFESGGREFAARLAPGDAVLYSGRETPHWRGELPDGRRRETLIFCCFA